jgi:hypothetical protein
MFKEIVEHVMLLPNNDLVRYVECLNDGRLPPQFEALSDGSSTRLVEVHLALTNECTRRFCSIWKKAVEVADKLNRKE